MEDQGYGVSSSVMGVVSGRRRRTRVGIGSAGAASFVSFSYFFVLCWYVVVLVVEWEV